MSKLECKHQQLSRSCQLCDYEKEIDDLKLQLASVERDALRYQWFKENATLKLDVEGNEEICLVREWYEFPRLLAYSDCCGNIPLDEAVDFKIENAKSS